MAVSHLDATPYRTKIKHHVHGRNFVAVQDRPQTTLRVLAVDPNSGASRMVCENTATPWTSTSPGVPAQTADGELVWVADQDNTRQLVIGGEPVSPIGLQVRSVLAVDGSTVLLSASTEQTEDHVWCYAPETGCTALTAGPGMYQATAGGGTTVIAARTLDRLCAQVRVHRSAAREVEIRNLSEQPLLSPRPHLFRAGEREIRTAVVLPDGHALGSGKLPVLMDPYGGPGGWRVLADLDSYLMPQWWANQGYAVVIADGTGTPGRDPYLGVPDPP